MKHRTNKEQAILDNIIACMDYKGLRRRDISDYLGKSPQMVTNWKNNTCNSYMKYLPEISTCLDVPLNYLTGKTTLSGLPELEERLLRYFSLCDTEGKLRIIRVAADELDRTENEVINHT